MKTTGGAPLLAVFEKWPIPAAGTGRPSCIRGGHLICFITVASCPLSLPPHPGVTILAQCGTTYIGYYGAGDLHFITCSCYRRQPLLGSPKRRDLFLKVLEQVRQRYVLVVVGYVVMPEHIHLLISEPQEKNLSVVMQALKLGFARRVLAGQRRRRHPSQADLFEHAPQHVWQKRFYDFNVWTARKRAEKLRYMHENPVRRGPGSLAGPVALEQFPGLLLWGSRACGGQ